MMMSGLMNEAGKIRGLGLVWRGKTANTYVNPKHPDYGDFLIIVAKDVEPSGQNVPGRGEFVTANDIHWQTKGGTQGVKSLMFGPKIDDYLPDELKSDPDYLKVTVVVPKAELFPVYGYVNGYLDGQALADYAWSGNAEVAGCKLRPGLTRGSRIMVPLFVPRTKDGRVFSASTDIRERNLVLTMSRQSRENYNWAREQAEKCRVILTGARFAFTRVSNDKLAPIGKWFSPDTTCYWDMDEWRRGRPHGTVPVSLTRDTENMNALFWRLTGMPLAKFQERVMGIAPQI